MDTGTMYLFGRGNKQLHNHVMTILGRVKIAFGVTKGPILAVKVLPS